MTASLQTKAYVLHHADRKPIAFVARELNITEDRALSLIEREHRARVKDDRAKPGPLRTHASKGTERRVCDAHGPYTATLWALDPPSRAPFAQPFWSKCPTCNAEIEQEQAQQDPKAMREALMKMALELANVPARWLHVHLHSFEHGLQKQRHVFEWAKDFAYDFALALSTGRSAVFCGEPGCGKTMLAIGILRHVVEKGGTACYATVQQMISMIRSTYSAKAEVKEAEALARYTQPDLLVLDEVGRNTDTDHDQAKFFRVVDERYGNMRPTILISNMGEADLKKFLGDAVLDRMKDGGGAILKFDWSSYRGKKGPRLVE